MLLYTIIPYLHLHFANKLDTKWMLVPVVFYFIMLFCFLLALSEVFQADNTASR